MHSIYSYTQYILISPHQLPLKTSFPIFFGGQKDIETEDSLRSTLNSFCAIQACFEHWSIHIICEFQISHILKWSEPMRFRVSSKLDTTVKTGMQK